MRKSAWLFSLVVLLLFAWSTTGLTAPEVTAAEKEWMANVIAKVENGQKLTEREAAWWDSQNPGTNELDDTGGPDSFGYVYIDSNEPDGPTYSWVDISETGTEILPGPSDDGQVGPFELGITFPFYGVEYTEYWIAGNGMISFQSGSTSSFNQNIPSTSVPNNIIAWFWDDLNYFDSDFTELVHIYTEVLNDGDQDYFVISFINYPLYRFATDPDAYITAQALLYEDGRIVLQYLEAGETMLVTSSTIGIENQTGTVALAWCYNNAGLTPADFTELAIEFYVVSADASVEGTVVSALTGDPVEGADVVLGPYNAVTGVDGSFTLEDIFSATYDVSISASGFFTYLDEVPIVSGVNTLNFELEPLPAVTLLDDMESGDGNWMVVSSTETPLWQLGTPAFASGPAEAYSGDNVWGTNLEGYYINNANDWLVWGETFVPTGSSMLSYYHWYNNESGWDGYQVRISTDGGETFEVIHPFIPGGYSHASVNGLGATPGWSGNGGGNWIYVAYDLSAYEGMECVIAFRFGSDSSVNSYAGTYIDDFALHGVSSMPVFSGVVTNATTEAPIEGAQIEFFEDILGPVATVFADEDGFFSVTVAPGTYTIDASAPGFDMETDGPFVMDYGDEEIVNFALSPGTVTVDFTGTVWSADSEGVPVGNASVTIVGAGQTAITNASGQFSFTGIVASTYNFYITHTPVGGSGYHDATIQVTVAQGMDPLDLYLPEILAPQNVMASTGDGEVTVSWDPPANHATLAALRHGIEIRQQTLAEMAHVTNPAALAKLNVLRSELNLLQQRLALAEMRPANELDDLGAFTGYRVRVDGEALPNLYAGTSAVVSGLVNGHGYSFEVAAEYGYQAMYRNWSDPVFGRPNSTPGYEWEDTEYDWVEIRPDMGGDGTLLLGAGDDASNPLTPMDGFTFQLYGATYDQMAACSNGWFSFLHTGSSITLTFPSTVTPNATVAPLNDDLHCGVAGDEFGIWGKHDEENNRYIVLYRVRAYSPSTSNYLFQAILNGDDNSLTFQYNTATGWNDAGINLIGIENGTGTEAFLVPNAVAQEESAVRIYLSEAVYGNFEGMVTELNSGTPIEGAIVTATGNSGRHWTGVSNADGFYEVVEVDQLDVPYTLEFRAAGYLDETMDVDEWGDDYVVEVDMEMTPIDPTTPPNIVSTNGTYDNGVMVTLTEPGSIQESLYIQYDDGTINDAVGWNPGFTTGYWFAVRFNVPGENVILSSADIRFLTEADLGFWWPAGDESHQPVVIGVFNDVGGWPGALVWSSAEITPEDPDPTVVVSPGVSVTSTFYVGFYNATPAAGQEPLCLDGSNSSSSLVLSTNNGDTWSGTTYGDPLARASVLYTPAMGGLASATLTPSGEVSVEKVADATMTASRQAPVWGMMGSSFQPSYPSFPSVNNLDEFLGYNVEYSLNGTDWTQSNTELITGTSFFVTIGSEHEGEDIHLRANALVTDPEGGDDITSDYTEVVITTYGMSPAAPTGLTGDSDDLTVTLNWTAPTTNADGTELVDLDGYGIWNVGTTTPTMLGTSETTNWEGEVPSTGYYAFAVTAYDEVPNHSPFSTPVEMLVGNPTIFTSFETGEWNEMAGDGEWQHGAPTGGPGSGHTGDNVWATNLTGNYSNSVRYMLESTEPFVINSEGALLSYWHYLNVENGWDGYNIKVSTDEGASWQIVTPVGGYSNAGITGLPGEPGFSGLINQWQLVRIPLGDFVGQAINFAFEFGTDGSVTYWGVAIDDLGVYGAVPPAYGTIVGSVHECSEDGPAIAGATIWLDGRSVGVTNANGEFDIEVLAGTHTVSFEHDSYWTVTLDGQDVPADGELDLGAVVMTRPIAGVDPTTLPMEININDLDPVTSTFELSNTGCGMMEYTVSVNILNAANQVIGSYPLVNGAPAEAQPVTRNNRIENPQYPRGPIATELNDLWTHIVTWDVTTPTGSGQLVGAAIVDGFVYVNNWVTPTQIWQLDFNGDLISSATPATGGVAFWNELAYDPTVGKLMTIGDNGRLYRFNPDGTNIENMGNVGHDAWGVGYDWDNGMIYWGDFFSSSWGSYNVATSQATTLPNPWMGSPIALAYAPNDAQGFTIWGAFRFDDGNNYVYGYNPTTGAWSGEGVLVYDSSVDGGVSGLELTDGFSDRLDIVGFAENTNDQVDVWEGFVLQSWLYVDPSVGVLLPNESATIGVTVDIHADDTFNPVDGQQASAQVIISGPHMADAVVTVDMLFGTSVGEEALIPMKYALHQNYPNPFNPSTAIKFDLVASQQVKLTVFNMLGQEVARLVDGQMQAGFHKVSFDASTLASGVYFYRLETPAFTKMKKMVLVK